MSLDRLDNGDNLIQDHTRWYLLNSVFPSRQFNSENFYFHNRYISHQSLNLVWFLKKSCKSSRGQWKKGNPMIQCVSQTCTKINHGLPQWSILGIHLFLFLGINICIVYSIFLLSQCRSLYHSVAIPRAIHLNMWTGWNKTWWDSWYPPNWLYLIAIQSLDILKW